MIKVKEFFLGVLNTETFVCSFIKNHYCVIWKTNRRDSSLNGVEEINRNFNFVKNKINGKNLKQRSRYRFPKHETIDQLENVFVFDLETYNDQEFADSYAAGIYDVSCLQNKWNRDLTYNELETGRKNVTILMDLM